MPNLNNAPDAGDINKIPMMGDPSQQNEGKLLEELEQELGGADDGEDDLDS